MTIKQQGGIFGRNPSFNDVDVVDLTATGDISADEFNGRRASLTEQVTISKSDATDAVLQMSNTAAAFFLTQSGNGSTYILNYGNQKMYFGMNGTEDFHLDTYGNINMVQGGGNLIVASGAGIDFSATSGTGTSELFDDYEEGTWTPSLDGTTSGTAGGYLLRTGAYTKVGRQVTAQATLVINAIGTLAGNFKITGLPFTSGGPFPSPYAATVGFSNVPSAGAGYNMQARVGHASTTLDIFRETGGVSSACPVGATFEFEVVVTYFI